MREEERETGAWVAVSLPFSCAVHFRTGGCENEAVIT